ncbi:Krueppel homolog 1-like [Anopheles nili]|uniref:Krueppel homolog 1-like n=1 Tax=Anopheles nili TaxID=185578 RepID=UPI00237AEBBF|nr:Krueppel homolog 1-like [Anopheles nili]
MKKSVETATTKVVAAAAAAAAAASLAENVDLWTQQDWIKNILSKSGTEIKEVPTEDLCKMVYYSGLPLLMTQQQAQQQQQQHQDGAVLQMGYNDGNGADQYASMAGPPSRNGGTNPYQQQHHTVSLTNGLTITNGSQGCSSNTNNSSSASSNTSNGQLTIVLNPPAPSGSSTYPASPIGGGSSSGTEPASYPVPVNGSIGNSKFRCEQCNISFGSKSAHTSHMKSHAKQATSEKMGGKSVDSVTISASDAGGSGAGTGSAGQLQTSQQPDPYQCDVCKKTFAVPARLVRHYRTHTGERPFECEFCHKMFSVKENLQVHRRIHTKERPYKCEICGRAFEHSGKLHRHMRIHTGERPHKCNVCGKTFIQSGQLVIHMRTHTGEKPYKCPVEGCGKGFTCSKQLKVHSRTHTGEKPYHCDICFRDFGYNHVLKLHRVQHYGAKCYKCTICEETFKSKKEMEAHIKGHANELPDEEETVEGGAACKQEDALSSAVDPSDPSSVLEGGSGSNSNSSSSSSSGSNSNSSFEYSSSMSHTEGLETGSMAGECAEKTLSRAHFTSMKPSVGSPSIPSSRVAMLEGMQMSQGDENGEEENDDDEEDIDRKQITNQYTQPYDQSLHRAYGGGVPTGGVAPALLAAASMAAAVENECREVKFCPDVKQQQRSISPTQPSSISISRITPPPSHGSSSSSCSSSSILSITPSTGAAPVLHESVGTGMTSASGQYMYEPMAIMKHHGYFAPASQITEFRSSSDIVRQVEAAIAGTENLLTPPRSSPESPDRSSSPESDSVLMADRDNNTLPPRKRKLYFKDSQQHQPQSASAPKLPALDDQQRLQHQGHYTVTRAPMELVQQAQPEAHSSQHSQQLFPNSLPQHATEQQHHEQQQYHQHRPEGGRSIKMEMLQSTSPNHEQRLASPTPSAPPQTGATSVIRMSSVIQYANKSS